MIGEAGKHHLDLEELLRLQRLVIGDARFVNYDCVRQTIEEDLPFETGFLRRFDAFREQVQGLIDMPDRTIDLLFRFLRQNDGKLSRRARLEEFVQLTDDEASRVEGYYEDLF